MSVPHPAPLRTVLFVAGAGRSGTSTMAGLMQILGLHVPQPEVAPDESNPKGFSEPQWVVDHHDRLLRDVGVQVADARPDAFSLTAEAGAREGERTVTASWLEGHLALAPELVVKDPRLSWFLELWRGAAARADARPVFATMLRPPAEVAGSRQTYYASRLGAAHLASSWLNVLLHTERDTRVAAGDRVFVRYADLLGDWAGSTRHVGETLHLPRLLQPGPDAAARADAFVDPSLRRMTQSLDDLGLPRPLHTLVQETWAELDRMADHGGDTPAAHAALDQLRGAYVALYAESEAITRSSVVAAEHRGRARAAEAGAGTAAGTGVPARGADRVPHGVRALVPAPLRRGLRRIARRAR